MSSMSRGYPVCVATIPSTFSFTSSSNDRAATAGAAAAGAATTAGFALTTLPVFEGAAAAFATGAAAFAISARGAPSGIATAFETGSGAASPRAVLPSFTRSVRCTISSSGAAAPVIFASQPLYVSPPAMRYENPSAEGAGRSPSLAGVHCISVMLICDPNPAPSRSANRTG